MFFSNGGKTLRLGDVDERLQPASKGRVTGVRATIVAARNIKCCCYPSTFGVTDNDD
jgi:hypothetical protein